MITIAMLALQAACAGLACDASAPLLPGRPTGAIAAAEPWSVSTARAASLQRSDPWLGPDKLRHFLTAFAVAGYAHAGLRALDADPDEAVIGGIAASIVAGIGKEIHDVRVGRFFSVKDLAWDVAGALAGGFLVRAAR